MAEFGNFHSGLTSAARGHGLAFTLSGAGAVQAFAQGGESKLPALIGGAIWAATTNPLVNGAESHVARQLTALGFTRGDLPDDSDDFIEGWDYHHAN